MYLDIRGCASVHSFALGYRCPHAAALASISPYKFALAHDCVINARRRGDAAEKTIYQYLSGCRKTGIQFEASYVAEIKQREPAIVFEEEGTHGTRIIRVMAIISRNQPLEFFCVSSIEY